MTTLELMVIITNLITIKRIHMENKLTEEQLAENSK